MGGNHHRAEARALRGPARAVGAVAWGGVGQWEEEGGGTVAEVARGTGGRVGERPATLKPTWQAGSQCAGLGTPRRSRRPARRPDPLRGSPNSAELCVTGV